MNVFHIQRIVFTGFIAFLYIFAFQDCNQKKNIPVKETSQSNSTNKQASNKQSESAAQTELTDSSWLNTETPIYGVTVDSIDNIDALAASLEVLRESRRPTVRIVFDPDKSADFYQPAVDRIRNGGANVMGMIADSSAMHAYQNTDEYKIRTEQYLQTMGSSVKIWEIGNEVNGEWVGYPRRNDESDDDFEKRLEEELPQKSFEELDAIRAKVAAQVTEAFRVIDRDDKDTALTLYYNDDNVNGEANKCSYPGKYCWTDLCRKKILEGKDYGMLNWVRKYLTDRTLRENLDYVFISFYEDDCKILSKDIKKDTDKWIEIFKELTTIFPNAKLGFGEFGPQCKPCKDKRDCRKCLNDQKDFIERYYKTYDSILKPRVSKYVGGYFYWYFKQDMVPKEKESLKILVNTLKEN